MCSNGTHTAAMRNHRIRNYVFNTQSNKDDEESANVLILEEVSMRVEAGS